MRAVLSTKVKLSQTWYQVYIEHKCDIIEETPLRPKNIEIFRSAGNRVIEPNDRIQMDLMEMRLNNPDNQIKRY